MISIPPEKIYWDNIPKLYRRFKVRTPEIYARASINDLRKDIRELNNEGNRDGLEQVKKDLRGLIEEIDGLLYPRYNVWLQESNEYGLWDHPSAELGTKNLPLDEGQRKVVELNKKYGDAHIYYLKKVDN